MKQLVLIGLFVFAIVALFVILSLEPVRVTAKPVFLHQIIAQATDEPTDEGLTETATPEEGEDNGSGNVFGGIDIGNLVNGPALTDTPGAPAKASPKASPTKKAPKPTVTPQDTPEEPTDTPESGNGNRVSVSADNTIQNPASIDLQVGGSQKKDFSQYGCGVGYFRSIDPSDPDVVLTLEQQSPYLVVGVSVPKGVTAVLVVSDPSGQNGLCTKTNAYHDKASGKTVYAAIVSFQDAVDGDYQVWIGTTKSQATVQARMQAAVLDENGQ